MKEFTLYRRKLFIFSIFLLLSVLVLPLNILAKQEDDTTDKLYPIYVDFRGSSCEAYIDGERFDVIFNILESNAARAEYTDYDIIVLDKDHIYKLRNEVSNKIISILDIHENKELFEVLKGDGVEKPYDWSNDRKILTAIVFGIAMSMPFIMARTVVRTTCRWF